MKARTVISFSIVGLLFIVLVQVGGMVYAYHAQMKEAEQSLNKCFRIAFTETVDNMVNTLPYPNGTVVNLISAPKRMHLDQNEFNFIGSEQTAWILQRVYKVKGFPLAALDSVLHKKLEHIYMEGDVTLERFNVNTGEILESIGSDLHPDFTAVTSEKAFVYKERGEAVRAIVAFPFGEMMRNVLVLFGITFLLLLVAVYTLAVQMKSLISQRRSLQEQQLEFYSLAEQMCVPVTEILSELPRQAWGETEEKSTVLLNMTEKTLSKAKAQVQEKQHNKPFSLKVVSVVSLVGIFLLLAVWFGYLYHIGYKKMELRVQDHFEEAFYKEVGYHRYVLFNQTLPFKESQKLTPTPYARRQAENIYDLYRKFGYHIIMNKVFVYHIYNKFDVDYRMHAAYTMQDTINSQAKVSIPFSLQCADSIFAGELRKGGILNESNVHWLKYPSKEMLIYTGSPRVGRMDLSTGLIPLNADSTYCVRGIVRSPQGGIVASIWYMLLPLGVTFLFMGICVFLQIRMLRAQRSLKQFQKDFTYSMIHDMKSPLTSVMAGAHILASGKLGDKPERVERYKQVITDECEHLLVLSGRVVMLTQIDRGELELHREEVILKPLLEDMAEKFLLKAPKKVDFILNCEDSCSVYADAFCLREVLSNLIDNAVKYSREEVEVVITCREAEGTTIITVRDNGIGIPLKVRHKIFDKFERVSGEGHHSEVSGFGLGLSYVMQVVEAHGGGVSVRSAEGVYSEFIVSLPEKVLTCT